MKREEKWGGRGEGGGEGNRRGEEMGVGEKVEE